LLRDLKSFFFADSGFDSYADKSKISELTNRLVENDVGVTINNTLSDADIEHALGTLKMVKLVALMVLFVNI